MLHRLGIFETLNFLNLGSCTILQQGSLYVWKFPTAHADPRFARDF